MVVDSAASFGIALLCEIVAVDVGSRSASQLTFQDLQFGQNCHKLIVVDAAASLVVDPQSSEGLLVQPEVCRKTRGEVSEHVLYSLKGTVHLCSVNGTLVKCICVIS